MPGLERHQITDRNGRKTHVWRGSRAAADLIAKNGGLIDQRAIAAGTRRTAADFDSTVTTATLPNGVTQSRDDSGLLHSANGDAAITYPDGTADFYWHGQPYQKLRYPALTLTVQQEETDRANQSRRRKMYDMLSGGRSGNTPAQAKGTQRGQTAYFWRGRPFKTEADWHAARTMNPDAFVAKYPALPGVRLAAH